MIINLTKENFQKEVLEETKPTLVDFYADWCPPCQALHPIFESLAQKYETKVNFSRLNIGEVEGIANQYNVNTVPTIIFFKEGKEIKRITGLVSQKELEKNIEDL